jgi:hypothetical protein
VVATHPPSQFPAAALASSVTSGWGTLNSASQSYQSFLANRQP